MNKRYIFAAIIIAIIAWFGFFVGKEPAVAPGEQGLTTPTTTTPTTVTNGVPTIPKKTTTSPSPTPVTVKTTAPGMTKDGSYIVSYTSSGFTPRALEIKKGKSVHFVNNSSKAMTIAAPDSVPQAYRELNQSTTVGRGGSFDFTFLTAGSWVYYNRNNPSDTGVVNVK